MSSPQRGNHKVRQIVQVIMKGGIAMRERRDRRDNFKQMRMDSEVDLESAGSVLWRRDLRQIRRLRCGQW